MKLLFQRWSVEENFLKFLSSLLHCFLLVMMMNANDGDVEGPLLLPFILDAPRRVLEWCIQGKTMMKSLSLGMILYWWWKWLWWCSCMVPKLALDMEDMILSLILLQPWIWSFYHVLYSRTIRMYVHTLK